MWSEILQCLTFLCNVPLNYRFSRHVISSLLKTYVISWNISNTFVLCLGVKPYACTMCDMRFIQRYQLERHSLTHTGMSSLFQLCLSLSLLRGRIKLEFIFPSVNKSTSANILNIEQHLKGAPLVLEQQYIFLHTFYVKWHVHWAKTQILCFSFTYLQKKK